MAKKKLLNPEYHEIICQYVREYGVIEGAVENLPESVSISTLKNALNPNSKWHIPELEAKVHQARIEYKTIHRHPKYDAEIQESAYDQFRQTILAGKSSTQEFTYDGEGRIVKKTFRQPGIEKWQWEVLHPSATFSEQSVIIVTASFYAYILDDPDISDDMRQAIIAYLSKLKRAALEELQKMGIKLK